jgi:large subunit ribosomal protein L17
VTTVPKAKELRRLADRLITLGKRETLHARRRVFSLLTNKAATDKLFATLAGRFTGRQGGYTRIVRTGYRAGDGAEMAILEYLPAEEKKAAAKGRKKEVARKTGERPAGAKKAAAKAPAKAKSRAESPGKKSDSGAPRGPRKRKAEPKEK